MSRFKECFAHADAVHGDKAAHQKVRLQMVQHLRSAPGFDLGEDSHGALRGRLTRVLDDGLWLEFGVLD